MNLVTKRFTKADVKGISSIEDALTALFDAGTYNRTVQMLEKVNGSRHDGGEVTTFIYQSLRTPSQIIRYYPCVEAPKDPQEFGEYLAGLFTPFLYSPGLSHISVKEDEMMERPAEQRIFMALDLIARIKDLDKFLSGRFEEGMFPSIRRDYKMEKSVGLTYPSVP